MSGIVVQLKDGTRETIFTPDHFDRLVREKMGDDAGMYNENRIKELQDEADYVSQSINTDLECYESSLESNNACFRDLLDSLSKLEEIIKAKKVIKIKALRVIDQMEREIHNQF